MTWPFVHRARLEAAEHIASKAEQTEREVRTQLVQMTQLVAEMKRAGFEGAPRAPLLAEPQITPLPPDVLVAISERAVEGTPIHRRLLMQARARLDNDAATEDVADWIKRGGNVDELLYGGGDTLYGGAE